MEICVIQITIYILILVRIILPNHKRCIWLLLWMIRVNALTPSSFRVFPEQLNEVSDSASTLFVRESESIRKPTSSISLSRLSDWDIISLSRKIVWRFGRRPWLRSSQRRRIPSSPRYASVNHPQERETLRISSVWGTPWESWRSEESWENVMGASWLSEMNDRSYSYVTNQEREHQ